MKAGFSRMPSLFVVVLVVSLPTIGVLFAMAVPSTAGTVTGKLIYALCKVGLLSVPLLWHFGIERRRIEVRQPTTSGLMLGLLTGLVISCVIIVVYLLAGQWLVDPEVMREAAALSGLADRSLYLWLAAYIIFFNSLLEEYVWRWFVYEKCRLLVGSLAAVTLAAFLFTIHHIVALSFQFELPVIIVGSVGVFVGGLIWSWCYLKTNSIWSGYVSHILVDIAVFVVGWMILFT